MKTVSVALVICLNVGVDPPDVTKTVPCARQECWVDAFSLNPQRALETIGQNLQRQYERWQPRARYRQSLDPTVEEVRRLATGLRRSARDERVLFHYNGHGVPRPTANGEIWVFNRSYTQYIPLSIYDLQTWMGSPSIYVWDCNNAGIIVESFKNFAEQHEREYVEQMRGGGKGEGGPPSPPSLRSCIQLAACSRDQLLPMTPDLPADLFTTCLTTPIKMALRWFVMRNDLGHLTPEVTLDQLEKIPGQFGDRRTMLGELNWIFTAITDTIAWNTLPRDTFQKLFRQDLLVASLFRNFLLAERIMKANDCCPLSCPALPATHLHHMWSAWDLALDICLSQLRGILQEDKTYVPSSFFEEQLTAFEVWLSQGEEERSPPEQLPIVLQVLLSQAHRLRALDLLGRFLDLGPWAVNLALSVGIFPYVLKLLQSSARELRSLLVFIWAKILAVDPSCQNDLVRDQSHKYFLTVVQDPAMLVQHKTWAVFVLASLVNNYKQGQDEAVSGHLISICLNELEDPDPVYRQWLVLCLATCWDRHEEARGHATRDNAPDKLESLLTDPTPEVRAAAVFALGTFMNSCSVRREQENSLDQNIAMRLIQHNLEDGSSLVRRELVVALQYVISNFQANFVTLMRAIAEDEESNNNSLPVGGSKTNISRISSEEKVGRLGSGGRRSVVEMSHSTPRRGRKSVASQSQAQCGSLAGLASLSSSSITSFKPFYPRVLGAVMMLERDPDPQVSGMARKVLESLQCRVTVTERERKSSAMYRTDSQAEILSVSAPGSPARPSFTLGCSPPPASLNTTLPNLSLSLTSSPPPPTRQDLPDLKTSFLSWSAQHFSCRLMRVEGEEDQESVQFWSSRWMFDRNEVTRRRAEEERDSLEEGSGRLDESLASHRLTGPCTALAWETFTGSLYGATRDTITQYTEAGGVTSWSNGNPRTSQISSMVTLNSQLAGLLAAGTDDGVCRVWRWRPESGHSLLTGWVLAPELVPLSLSGGRVSSGLQISWSQQLRHLVAGGDSRLVRVWDCGSELRLCDLNTGLDTCVTAIEASSSRNIVTVSFGDGHIKMFDYRARPSSVMTFREHQQLVLSVVSQEQHRLVSGCADGVVKVWDVRRQSSLSTLETGQPAVSLDIHQTAPLFSVSGGGPQHQLTVWGLGGNIVNTVRTVRPGTNTTTICHHPTLLRLAAAASDLSLGVWGYRKY